ncbi:MAG TPA: aminoacyl-histidine dipeptidase [Bacteroidales bacterium]|nr:aminoacyl-histidine dipeptidase [Bacteroidales bacterium]
MKYDEILTLGPAPVWRYFAEILTIPRPSKREGKIIEYLRAFGEEHNLETKVDDIGNVIIRKPATAGMGHKPVVILQSHMDMVCEKNNDIQHDFDNDPILPRIEGGWVKATGTTLGADDGIGMAAQLAILAADDIPHGPLECLFTVDEETGLSGAFALQPGQLHGRILLNLDSEDEGEIFIGCAGGKDTVAEFDLQTEAAPAGYKAFRVLVSGLTGGHSGDDIHKGRGNAVKVLNRILWHGAVLYGLRVSRIDAGNLRNAIAREGEAVVVIPADRVAETRQWFPLFAAAIIDELHATEPDLKIRMEPADMPAKVLTTDLQERLLGAMYACPHGVIEWSREIPNFVETSTNLASLKMDPLYIMVTTSQRSSVESAKEDICTMVGRVFALAGGRYRHSDGYPGWTPNPASAVLKVSEEAYRDLFGGDPKVLAIHAGLECGVIGEKYPGMDMISYGPTIKGAHSPDERLEIASVDRFWRLTLEILGRI